MKITKDVLKKLCIETPDLSVDLRYRHGTTVLLPFPSGEADLKEILFCDRVQRKDKQILISKLITGKPLVAYVCDIAEATKRFASDEEREHPFVGVSLNQAISLIQGWLCGKVSYVVAADDIARGLSSPAVRTVRHAAEAAEAVSTGSIKSAALSAFSALYSAEMAVEGKVGSNQEEIINKEVSWHYALALYYIEKSIGKVKPAVPTSPKWEPVKISEEERWWRIDSAYRRGYAPNRPSQLYELYRERIRSNDLYNRGGCGGDEGNESFSTRNYLYGHEE